jgi:truncated hemoglobin YjbI
MSKKLKFYKKVKNNRLTLEIFKARFEHKSSKSKDFFYYHTIKMYNISKPLKKTI